MKIDDLGCMVMEKDGFPGDVGDSCAETGRFITLIGFDHPDIKLESFIVPTGFLRHPRAPEGWRESDFTSDQMVYLLMGAYLVDRPLFDKIVRDLELMTKFKSPDVWFLAFELHNFLGVSTCIQMLINKFPWRWADGGEADGHWYSSFWRFVSSDTSTVSYMTVFVSMVFLNRVGVTWPSVFFNREKYLARAKAYYKDQPNSDWFTNMYEVAPV